MVKYSLLVENKVTLQKDSLIYLSHLTSGYVVAYFWSSWHWYRSFLDQHTSNSNNKNFWQLHLYLKSINFYCSLSFYRLKPSMNFKKVWLTDHNTAQKRMWRKTSGECSHCSLLFASKRNTNKPHQISQ